MATIVPNTQMGSMVVMGKPIQTPTGTAPRNSTTGKAEIMAKTSKSGMPKLRKKLAFFWPVWSLGEGGGGGGPNKAWAGEDVAN